MRTVARAWIAHSKLSNVCEAPPGMVTEKALEFRAPPTNALTLKEAAQVAPLPSSGYP